MNNLSKLHLVAIVTFCQAYFWQSEDKIFSIRSQSVPEGIDRSKILKIHSGDIDRRKDLYVNIGGY